MIMLLLSVPPKRSPNWPLLNQLLSCLGLLVAKRLVIRQVQLEWRHKKEKWIAASLLSPSQETFPALHFETENTVISIATTKSRRVLIISFNLFVPL